MAAAAAVLLPLLLAAGAKPPADERCSLNGHMASGGCVCRPAWRGPSCASLVLQPAVKVFEVPEGWTAWGASPIADEHGNWHMFVAVYKTWHYYNPYSHVVHVKAAPGSGPEGPYSSWMYKGSGGTIMPPYTCSPAVVKIVDEEGPLYLLYGDGAPWHPPAGYDPANPPEAKCTDPMYCGLKVAHSRSLDGPWNVTYDLAPHGPGIGNPSVVVLENGTFVFGGEAGSNGGVFRAPGPFGPFTPLKALSGMCKGEPSGGGLCSGGGDWLWLKSPNTSNYFMEDSRIYRTRDGNWHLLCHALALGGDCDECSADRCAPHGAAHSKPTSRELDLVRMRRGGGLRAPAGRRSADPTQAHNFHTGGHAFTKDPTHEWTLSPTPAYTTNITWRGNSTWGFAYRRERPFMLFDEEMGDPSWLFNGVYMCGNGTGRCSDGGVRFVMAQKVGPVKTDDLLVELGGSVVVANATARWCKLGQPGSAKQPDGRSWSIHGQPCTAMGYALYRKMIPINATHAACPLPPVFSACSPGLFYSGDDASSCRSNSSVCPVNWELARRVSFEAVVQASLTRRPYTDGDASGSLIVGVAPVVDSPQVTMSIGEAVALGPVAGSDRFAKHSFPLPAVGMHDVNVSVSGTLRGKAISVWTKLLLQVVPAQDEATLISVDYEHRILRVNRTKPLMIQGYYDVPNCGRGTLGVCFNTSDIALQGSLGYTAVMYYEFFNGTIAEQDSLLDALAANGMYLMAAVQLEMEFGVALHGLNSTEGRAAWNVVAQRINRIKNHSALLGWYVCDDCFGQYLRRQLANTPETTLDQLYAKIKALDPNHPIIGATNTGFDFSYTHASELMPRPALDIVMTENYHANLQDNANLDYSLWPSTFEPTVNSAGTFSVEHCEGRHPCSMSEANKSAVINSFAWLSAVAEVPQQLYFRRAYVHSAAMMDSLGQFSQDAAHLSRFLAPSMVGRLATPAGPRCSCDGAASPCAVCVSAMEASQTPMLKAAALPDASSAAFCTLVVVVNMLPLPTKRGEPYMPTVRFSAMVEAIGHVSDKTVCTRLGGYGNGSVPNRTLALESSTTTIRFTDSVAGGATALYTLCEA